MARREAKKLEFGKVYPALVAKAERKGRTREEVEAVIAWLTGYDKAALERQAASGNDFETFFAEAPALNPARERITGAICGIRVEEIEDEGEKRVRQLDKLIDELAKGRAMEKILRS
ncbi:DUF2200 domain-containing protein [Croceibacterium aestuarii]|uniref:DUF2200 domain-containing protein n=1 Tax=Croceibacterium aestuarii TaxID=3064139 RepID=UPI00272E6F3E|nr:DUF2200 domain-containing protein [Croceibacterium sp. D39]